MSQLQYHSTQQTIDLLDQSEILTEDLGLEVARCEIEDIRCQSGAQEG